MTEQLQAWLYRRLGQERYLHLISRLFFLSYRSGWLRLFPDFQCHYYVRQLIQPGDCVIDIGANLGYYTVLFAEWTGEKGKVYSVEPIRPYRKILRRNTEGLSRVEILPYALGPSAGTVQMGIPGSGPHRHGHNRILSAGERRDVEETYDVEVQSPETLFADLPQLDYVKCDVEGFEGDLLPAMEGLLQRHRPILQVEVSAENRTPVFWMMKRMGYRAYFVQNWSFVPIRTPDDHTRGDWIFRPDS